MNKQDMMKIQTCVLRVNIHCEGCKHKVKKKLQKVEGVYKVSIDVEQGKVTVYGNVDPSLLLMKLEKAGKHAELWGPQKGTFPMLKNNQFKNIQFDNLKDIKAQKGGFQVPQQMQMQQKKGLKDEKSMGKDQKSVKFKLPEDEYEDDFYDDSDDFDEYDDEFDDEFDEGFGAHQPPSKATPVGQGKKPTPSGDLKAKNGGKNGGKGKKGGGMDMFLKGILGKTSGKHGNGGKKSKKGENKKEDTNKNSKKHGGFPLGNGKDGAGNGKGAGKNGGGKAKDNWSKKAGEDFDKGQKLDSKQHGFNEMNVNHKGGGGGGGGGRNMDFMGQMGGFPSVQGLPAMNGGRFQMNPYNQQYMAQMMMNQQRENAQGAFNPMNPYTRPHPAMGYGPPPMAAGYGPPPPGSDPFTHMFSDENTDSCSIM